MVCIQIQQLSAATLTNAIALVDAIFPYQHFFEKASIAFRLSLMPVWLSRPCLRLWIGVNWAQYWVVCNDRGTVLGITGLYEYARDARESCWLGWTGVDPNARGLGIGSQLVDFAIARARASGKRYLRLYTSDRPEEAVAQILYERRGLKIVGDRQVFASPYRCIYRELDLQTSPTTSL